MSYPAGIRSMTSPYPVLAKGMSSIRQDTLGFKWAAFLLAHLPLGLLLSSVKPVATAHALVTLAIGGWFALSSRQTLLRTAYVGAYITGAEVLWRMAGAQVYWEYGKYGIVFIFILALLRNGNYQGSWLPVLYFGLLLPSCALLFFNLEFLKTRDELSFNMSGPLALMICAYFFSNLKLSSKQLQRLILLCVSPAMAVAGLAFAGIYSNADLRFTNASNVETSGGFGPNQVSPILGLGALLIFLFLIFGGIKGVIRVLLFAAMLFLAAQSALTFSRGGLYNVAGALALASIYLVRDRRTRAIFFPIVSLVVVAAYFVLIPRLDDFTQGTLSARFQNTDSTNRVDIAMAQLQVWQENPVLGIGPGQARTYAGQIAHTEVTRLLAEHGIFGFAALLLLLFMVAINLKNARTAKGRAFVMAAAVWAFLFMLNAGMRIVAPSFIFGLSFGNLIDGEAVKLRQFYQRMKRSKRSGQSPAPAKLHTPSHQSPNGQADSY